MTTNERSGPFAGGNLGRHGHICAFFHGMDEQHRVLRSFLTEGFDQGEKAFHIVDGDLREAHLKWLGDAGIDVPQAMGSGQLEVRPWQEAYLRGDRFDQDAMLALLEQAIQSRASAGYPRVRLLGHMEWALLDKPGVEDLLEYETRINYALPNSEDVVVCCYDLAKFGASVAIDIMRTHPAVIIGGMLHENPFFVPPDQFLAEVRERKPVRPAVRTAAR
jgi:hypothetical protein